ncbi:VOC family protein [Croceicoccus mobilis]|uniref:VOC domain-containing protein n=1 Tax=Croceicoccus mobilis TaxID=1703339 RepID=A0A916Z0V6_9SPHN|nr:VOC family protein [Croceicoccus mobilis]GGD69927.1 hypothetical protein GCM10010990_19290 [Croceicoccus mobilis]
MFSHVHLGANDVEKSRRFYDAIMGVLGAGPGTYDAERNRYFWSHNGTLLIVGEPLDGEAATAGNGMTIGFTVEDEAMGHKWYETACANGGTGIEEPPSVRTKMVGDLFLAYVRDPDGNKLCALKVMG